MADVTVDQALRLSRARTGFPPQIKYIIGNEACERFSYYGMRSILVIFMTQYLMMAEHNAKGIYHLFISANYFTPLLGGYLADRYLGKYKTILYLSLLYCVGHGVLAVWESKEGLYAGLALIALGSGGIKPCISAHVGDQFNRSNSHLIDKVYMLFYWSVNFGSFFATLLIPWVLPKFGPSVAFGIPGILMGMATVIFWMGREKFVIVPPSGPEKSSKFWNVLFYSVTHLSEKKKGESFLDVARAKFDAHRVDGAKAAVDVFKVIVFVGAFWALFEQHGGSWVLQAKSMHLEFLGMKFLPSQIQALNPVMVMALIPIFNWGLYPLVQRMGIEVTPLRKMGAGMALTGFSFVLAAAIQYQLDAGVVVGIGWQIPQYLVLTMAEVMVSITGLEFAYTQAPRAMKSTIMGLWLLTVTIGNLFTAVINFLNRFHGWSEFFFFAVCMFVVAAVFVIMASRYKYRSYIESGTPA